MRASGRMSSDHHDDGSKFLLWDPPRQSVLSQLAVLSNTLQ